MRWVHLSVIVVLVVATLIFALQNFAIVGVWFLNFGIRAPLAVLVVVVYIIGAATGSSALALLRRLAAGSRPHA